MAGTCPLGPLEHSPECCCSRPLLRRPRGLDRGLPVRAEMVSPRVGQPCYSPCLVDDLINGGLLVTRACYNIFVIR